MNRELVRVISAGKHSITVSRSPEDLTAAADNELIEIFYPKWWEVALYYLWPPNWFRDEDD